MRSTYIRFCLPEFRELLLEGWAGSERRHTWALGNRSSLFVPILAGKADYLLLISCFPCVFPPVNGQRLEVFANDRLVHSAVVVTECVLSFVVRSDMIDDPQKIRLRFEHPDSIVPSSASGGRSNDHRELAIAFSSLLCTEANPGLDGKAKPNSISFDECPGTRHRSHFPDQPSDRLAETFTEFDTLGDDCEFGLFQRRISGRKLFSLFRFASIDLPSLIHGLQGEFSRLAEADSFDIIQYDHPNHDLMGCDRYYGILYHTGRSPRDVDKLQFKISESQRLRYLARKLFEDICDAGKIFVIKRKFDLGEAEIGLLMETLRSLCEDHCTVLWISEAKTDDLAGCASVLGPKLIRAFVRRIDVSPLGNIDVESWTQACLSAHELWMRTERFHTPRLQGNEAV